MKSIQLPILKQPPILCYNHHAHFLSVLFTQKEFEKEFLNYYTGLRLTVGDENIMNFTDIITSSCNQLFNSFRIIFSNTTDYCHISNYNIFDVVSYAEKALSAGYYLTGSWDEKHVPATKAYQNESILHDYLIYGFNSENKTFHIIGYDQSSKYCESLISYHEMKAAFYFPGNNTSIVSFQPQKEQCYSFDVGLCCKKIKTYLEPKQEQNTYYNIAALEKYLKILTDTPLSENLDLRIVQVIYEHKNAMLDKIKYLLQANNINCNKYIENYEYIRKQSLVLKNMALKFNYIKQQSIKNDMCEIMNQIINREKIILLELLTKLEQFRRTASVL